MAERVFCVDFGSAFTKVALRAATQENTALVPCSDEGLELWAPTVVAADWTTGTARLEFGYKAAGIKPGGKISVYTNFKKDLFAPPATDAPGPHPLDALLQSDEFEALATKYHVLPSWVSGLRIMVQSARAMLGVSAEGASAEARRQEDAKKLAYHYFKWLRKRVLAACEKLPHTALKYEDIPLRVSVPVLGTGPDLEQHPGCQRLREALASTGWKLDDRLFVSEPESNAIGVLSQATNAITKRNKINLGEMLNKGPLNAVLAGDEHFPTYRALVIDVGAFTTDFAALFIDTGGKKAGADTSGGAGFQITQQSIRFGVTNLDASVRSALTSDKQTALESLKQKDFAEFQNGAYTEGKGYRVTGTGIIGGEADRDAIQSCLTEFTTRLNDETTAFCKQLGPASKQELILTGGGNNIPLVRDALMKTAAQIAGSPFVKSHAPRAQETQRRPASGQFGQQIRTRGKRPRGREHLFREGLFRSYAVGSR